MSDIRAIAAHVTDSPRSAAVLQLAAALAEAHGATLTALYAVEPMHTGAYLTPEASSIAASLRMETEQARHDRAVALVANATGGRVAPDIAGGDPLAALLQRARGSDLLVLGQHDPHTPDGTSASLAGRLLVGASCPVLFVPYAGEFPRCGSRVVVAWSDKRESARALRDALPLLKRAVAVEVVRFSKGDEHAAPPLDAVLEYLARHGVAATATERRSREPSLSERMLAHGTPDASIAEALLSHAADCNADLVVMGGYGHPRAWEMALGGVTRTVLHSMTVPVLMSH